VSSSWTPWILRARRLALGHPFGREILEFQGRLYEFQGGMERQLLRGERPRRMEAASAAERLQPFVSPLLDLVMKAGPERLSGIVGSRRESLEAGVLQCAPAPGDAVALLIVKSLLQPFARLLESGPEGVEGCTECPSCGGSPVAGVLRDTAEGRPLELVCSLCSRPWRHPRVSCLRCGTTDPRCLSGFTFEEFPHLRLSCCESCRAALKVIDLRREPEAIAEVDDLASIPIDLWAESRGFVRPAFTIPLSLVPPVYGAAPASAVSR